MDIVLGPEYQIINVTIDSTDTSISTFVLTIRLESDSVSIVENSPLNLVTARDPSTPETVVSGV